MRRDVQVSAVVFGIALATILAAWAFQIGGGYIPCKLCLEERLPYYVGVPLAFVALANGLASGPAWLTRTALAIAAIVFLYGAYLGTFHAGVEWSWWPGPTDCGAGAAGSTTGAGNLLDELNAIRIVPCDRATWRFPADWGLSFAGWNAAVSLLLAAVAAWGATLRRHPPA